MFRRRPTHDDFADEIASRVDLEPDRLVAEGMTREPSPATARSRSASR